MMWETEENETKERNKIYEGERLSQEKQGRKGQPLEDQNRDSIEAKGDPNQNPGLTKFANVETYTDTMEKKGFLYI